MLKDEIKVFDILLVEDEQADAHLVRTVINQCQSACNVVHVKDGAEALAFLRRKAELNCDAHQPDLILLDLNMPRMNGREFLEIIKADEDLASIPVVVLTTSESERDVDMAYRLKASGFVTKPVDMERFIVTMRQLLAYWLTLTRLPKKG